MLYLYHKDAGSPALTLSGDDHRYLFKVRRHKAEDIIYLRNLTDPYIYGYEVVTIDKRSVTLSCISKEEIAINAPRKLHIGWCVIDPKNIEKMLPSLNELGVEKITFIYCQRSQKSFKPDFKRLNKILLNSSQQSGRSSMMELEIVETLQAFLQKYPQSYMLNFSKKSIESVKDDIETIVIGCEGGFSEDERSLFDEEKIVGFATPLVLKSETAVCAVAAKLLV